MNENNFSFFKWSRHNFIPDTWEFNVYSVLETINASGHFYNCGEVDVTEIQNRFNI